MRSLLMTLLWVRRRTRTRTAGAIVAGLTTAVPVTSALASPSASVQETLYVGVRSLTVSPSALSICSSGSPLTFPNGVCDTPRLMIANGAVSDHIDASGADAVPSDSSGSTWTLCGGGPSGAPICSGPRGYPGPDQYAEGTGGIFANGDVVGGQLIGPIPDCDRGVRSWHLHLFGLGRPIRWRIHPADGPGVRYGSVANLHDDGHVDGGALANGIKHDQRGSR
jgi:hypothetical protein